MNEIDTILNNIDLLHKRKNIIWQILKQIIISQLKFEVYWLNQSNDFSNLVIKYGNEIIKLMQGCFSEYIPHFTPSYAFWVIVKLDDVIASVLMVDFRHKDNNVFLPINPWIWNVCRNTGKKYNGYGIGEYMLKWTLKYLKSNFPHYKNIYLWAAQKPVSRTKFYLDLGFKLTGIYAKDKTPEMVFIQI